MIRNLPPPTEKELKKKKSKQKCNSGQQKPRSVRKRRLKAGVSRSQEEEGFQIYLRPLMLV